MAILEGELVVGIGPVPKTHLDQTDQDRITDVALVPSIDTGGEGQYNQWVHCEFIVGSETIRPAHTQQVSGGHFQKVPSTKPSGYILNEPPLFFGKVSTKYPEGIL